MTVFVACGVVLSLGALALWLSARAAITIALLEVRDGHVRVVRGGLAPRVLGDVRDVLARPRVSSARVRVVRSNGRAQVLVSGKLTGQQVQRLRNVIGTLPMAQLVNARRR